MKTEEERNNEIVNIFEKKNERRNQGTRLMIDEEE